MTIREVLQAIALDYQCTLFLRGGHVVTGTMSEWDWEGEVVSLLQHRTNIAIVSDYIEVRIDDIVAVSWPT